MDYVPRMIDISMMTAYLLGLRHISWLLTPSYCRQIMHKVESVAELSRMSQEALVELMGDKGGKQLHGFFNRQPTIQ
jgi:hypothetical protein